MKYSGFTVFACSALLCPSHVNIKSHEHQGDPCLFRQAFLSHLQDYHNFYLAINVKN